MSNLRSRLLLAALLLLPVVAFAGWVAFGRPGAGADAEDLLMSPEEIAALEPAEADTLPRLVAPGADSAQADSVGPLPAPDNPNDYPEDYSTWTTYDAALRESKEKGKPVLLDFDAEWSDACRLLREEVFRNPAAGVTVKATVVPVAIVDRVREDGENPPEVESLERRYKVTEFPTLVMFSPASGRTLRKQGYAGAEATLRWITESAEALR